MPGASDFRAARPWGWVIRVVQTFLRFDLSWRNRVHIETTDLAVLGGLPSGMGLILASNHADEKDFEVCLDLSRRCGRRLLFMMNREAFSEGFGVAGWWLQRLGAFSVERGGENDAAKRFAIDIVKRGREVLVIFPEGEIFYLNDRVQPLKSGAVDIGMQAVVESQSARPGWTAYLIPMAIKYRHRRPIGAVLERRIRRLERRLLLLGSGLTPQQRLAGIRANVLNRQEFVHHLTPDPDRLDELSERVKALREEILSQVAGRYTGSAATAPAEPMDRAWRLSARLRGLSRRAGRLLTTLRAQIRNDLEELKHVAQMGGWQPQYTDLDPSQERLAETVLKLEREVYGGGRPRQLARREVFVRIGRPIDLVRFLPAYREDAHGVRHRVAEELRGKIQDLLDLGVVVGKPASEGESPPNAESGEPGGSLGVSETHP
jgi:1-acyl-sn-glycerol-3-phosphate acyltransferase